MHSLRFSSALAVNLCADKAPAMAMGDDLMAGPQYYRDHPVILKWGAWIDRPADSPDVGEDPISLLEQERRLPRAASRLTVRPAMTECVRRSAAVYQPLMIRKLRICCVTGKRCDRVTGKMRRPSAIIRQRQ